MNDGVAALHASVDHPAKMVDGFGPDRIRQPAYPAEWTVADTLSHLGSAAVIMRRGFEEGVAGRDADGDVNQSVWDEWSAKSPDDQAADALEAMPPSWPCWTRPPTANSKRSTSPWAR